MESAIKKTWAIVLLAAGSSKRLGRAKQLVPFGGSNLLAHSLAQVRASAADHIFLVLGHQSADILNVLDSAVDLEGVKVLFNPDYQRGMGKSMAFAMQEVQNYACDAVVFCLCDQPFLNDRIISDILKKYQNSAAEIVVSVYASGASGPPCLFSQAYFSDIQKLDGDTGAKSIVLKHKDVVASVPFPEGDIDIDTSEDLAELL